MGKTPLPPPLGRKTETTGRKFRCIGLREKEVENWNDSFLLGEIYREYTKDISGNNRCTTSILLLKHDIGLLPLYVDADQFELVEDEVKQKRPEFPPNRTIKNSEMEKQNSGLKVKHLVIAVFAVILILLGYSFFTSLKDDSLLTWVIRFAFVLIVSVLVFLLLIKITDFIENNWNKKLF